MSVRNAISSGHNILSTIHADKARSIPLRMYSLMESSQDVQQFLTTIHRYVQIGIYVKGYFSKKFNRFQREIIEVCEFYVDENNQPCTNEIYKKSLDGQYVLKNPTQQLLDYLSIQNVMLEKDTFHLGDKEEYDGNVEDDLKKSQSNGEVSSNVNTAPVESVNTPSQSNQQSETLNIPNQNLTASTNQSNIPNNLNNPNNNQSPNNTPINNNPLPNGVPVNSFFSNNTTLNNNITTSNSEEVL